MCKILVNALQFSKDGAGISRYSQKLSECILNENIDILCRTDLVDKFKNKRNLIPIDINKSSDRIIKEQLLNLNLYRKYDLIHFLDYATPAMYRGKKIATIHDMAMHTMEDKYTKGQIITKKILLKNTIKHANKLICISEFTAKELLKFYPNTDEKKIEVIYNGFEYNKVDIKDEFIKKTLKKFEINKKYLLFVGTLSPHKNIERIIDAFNEVKKNGYDYQLVICGKKGWMYNDILKKSKVLNLEKEVIFTDYVKEEELEILYGNAEQFIFPSLYEGFGFPPIEAMARKVPVIVSREGALPEVVGNAGLFCDAYDYKDISKKIIKLINNYDLRTKLIEEGTERVKYFSWENTSIKTNNIYQNLLK